MCLAEIFAECQFGYGWTENFFEDFFFGFCKRKYDRGLDFDPLPRPVSLMLLFLCGPNTGPSKGAILGHLWCYSKIFGTFVTSSIKSFKSLAYFWIW